MVQKWWLPSLSEILAQSEQSGLEDKVAPQLGEETVTQSSQRSATSPTAREYSKAQREWSSAIATLEELLLQEINQTGYFANQESVTDLEINSHDQQLQRGLILAGPVPVLSQPDLLANFQTGVFTTEAFDVLSWMPFQLSPAQNGQSQQTLNTVYELPLFPVDPLAAEQFCLVFTSHFSLVMAMGVDLNGTTAFRFSFDSEVIKQIWVSLRPRILLTSPQKFSQLESLVKQFAPKPPDYRIVMQFGRQLLKKLPELPQQENIPAIPVTSKEPISRVQTSPNRGEALKTKRNWQPLKKNEERGVSNISNPREATADIELLQALTHEIRTPLTTIRTLTKLLLKRRDLAPEVIRRLEIIDHECTEQINRMELIFRAVELETAVFREVPVNLTSISLAQVFENSIPRWQKQAQRRNLTLDVVLPQKLPAVVSNPNLLDQVLTGLMENFTRSIPAGGQIQLQVIPAGNQLKLQFQSHADPSKIGKPVEAKDSTCPTLKSIGQLLMLQPETGSLSLNLDVTKNLFQALGGKLIVRQRPQAGEVMTIFLPLEVKHPGVCTQKETFTKKMLG
ncbi:histidine kinase dimerization/phospho-acceptor domain-containing protein [Lyngbya aestuarii]|uniref:histidine kinase dimerization/phospho-acceptor domain-containing protein n=1 Tax=Lyngbya aestuarii TaxID=118322 RepID=UPI00403DABDD